MSYLTYSDSRTSNVEWIGEIPQHWHVSYVRRFYDVDLGKMVNQAAQNGSGTVKPYLRAANIHWGRIDIDDVNEMEFTPDQLQRYRLAKGDLLVTEGGVTVGRSAIWGGQIDECYYQNSLNRVRPKNSRQSVEFLYYWMYFTKSNGYVDLITNNATFNHLTNEKLLAFPILEIPFEEQIAIANFLDHETTKIDTLIAKQQRLIELLQEKRQALISHAVTKGLNPDVPMKDSGVEWIGEIPEHWEFVKIKWIFQTTSGSTPNTGNQDTYYNGDIPWLRTLDLNNDEITRVVIFISQQALEDTACKLLPPSSVLVAMYGGEGTIGKNAILRIESTVNQAICAILPISTYLADYLHQFIKFYRPFWMVTAEGTRKDPNISQQQIRDVKITVPPFEEQVAINSYLNVETGKLDVLTSKAEHAVNLLQERRSSLISAAVTGKIDVRGHV